MRTILTLAYKYKLIIYSKVFIFSFLYSLAFIIVKFIQIKYKNVEDGFLFIYYIDISLKSFLLLFYLLYFSLLNILHTLKLNFIIILICIFLLKLKKKKKKIYKLII